MPNNNPMEYGLLSQYGLDLDPAKIIEEKQKKRQMESLALLQLSQGNKPVFNQTQQIGSMLANKLAKPPTLSADEQKRVAVGQRASLLFNNWLNTQEGASANETEKAERYRKILAEAAYSSGLPGVGAQVAEDYRKSRSARERDEMELANLGYEADYNKRTHEARVQADLINAGKAGLVEVYPVGSNNPNASMAGMYNPKDGSVTVGDKVLPHGTWKLHRPMAPSQIYGGRGGSSRGGRITPTEEGHVRRQLSGVTQQFRTIEGVLDLFEEAKTKGIDGKVIMGDVGKATRFATRLVNGVEGIASMLSPTGEMGDLVVYDQKGDEVADISGRAGRQKMISKYNRQLVSYLPSQFRATSEMSNRYVALMTELVYAKARASEGGATRSLSDMDFLNNAKMVGASLTDPEALANLLFEDVMRSAATFNQTMLMYPPEVRSNIIFKDAMDDYHGTQKRVEDKFRGIVGDFYAPEEETAAPELSEEDTAAGWELRNGVKVRRKAGQ